MSNIITYSQCPVCDSKDIREVMKAKDETVSHEFFPIWHCNDCMARFTQNVPVAEAIGAYYQSAAYVSHSDTKEGLINKLYHLIRNYTLQNKAKLVEKFAGRSPVSLLDVGAGTGAFVSVMLQHGWQATGLEPDDTAKENALKQHGLTLQNLDAIFSFGKDMFDVITLWHVLEHVHQLHEYIETFYTILKDNGIVFIAVPNYTCYDASVYKEYWAAYDVPRHLYHFSPKSMEKLTQQHGFEVISFKPMWFDSFYVAMLSEQYKTGHNHFIRAIWNGMVSNLKALGNYKKCSSVIYVIKKKGRK